MSIFLLFQACESVRVYCWPLLFVPNLDIKNPQPTQTIISCFFIRLDTCNGGLVINKLNELTSYNHTNAGVL